MVLYITENRRGMHPGGFGFKSVKSYKKNPP